MIELPPLPVRTLRLALVFNQFGLAVNSRVKYSLHKRSVPIEIETDELERENTRVNFYYGDDHESSRR